MIDYSDGTNKFSPTKHLFQEIRKNVHRITEYPDYNNGEVRGLIKKHFGISSEHIALGIGSTQLLFDMPNFLSYKRAVIFVPTFWEYETFNTLFKKKITQVFFSEETDFTPDFALIRSTLKPGDCVFIANVNSPTSVLYKREELLALVQDFPAVMFVIDETYLMFRSDYKKQSLLHEATQRENLVVVTSFSKFFALPGARVGFFAAHKVHVGRYNAQFHIPYSLGALTQVALAHQLKDAVNISGARKFFDDEGKRIHKLIQKNFKGRLYAIKPQGNFIMCRILTGQTSRDIKRRLEKKGFMIRGGHELTNLQKEWIRFSFPSKKNDDLLLAQLDQLLN